MSTRLFCFVSMGNLYLCPYIHKYLGLLECDYDIVYWNRDGVEEYAEARNVYRFDFPLAFDDGSLRKLKGYLAFGRYASRVLTTTRYDGVVLLQSLAGVLLSHVLKQKYVGRYILDIRDYTLEHNRFYYCIERELIRKSSLAVISSEAYRRFLPDHGYVLAHNNRPVDEQFSERIRSRNKNRKKLVVASIGYQAYQNQYRKLLRILGNDVRFELQFIGKESERLIQFCEENNIRNVKIIGKYPAEGVLGFYDGVDVINNWYGNDTPNLDYALSNKLYLAAQLHIPILVSKGTYMETVAVGGGFGCSMDLEKGDCPESLYDYYQGIDWASFATNCDLFMDRVRHEDQVFTGRAKGFFEGVRNDQDTSHCP